MAKVSFDGVTGQVAFDEYGDTTNKLLTVYKVKGGNGRPSRPAPPSELTQSAPTPDDAAGADSTASPRRRGLPSD